MSLTFSYGCWLSLNVSPSKMELLYVSYCLPLLLALSHCFSIIMELLHVSNSLLLLLAFSYCLFSRIALLQVSHCVL